MISSRSDTGLPSVKDGEHPHGDLGQMILFGFFLCVWVLDSFFLRFSTLPARWIPLWLRLAAGGILILESVAFMCEAHGILQKKIRGGTSVVKDGVFARVRHPLYFGMLLFYSALVVSTASLAGLGLLIAIFIFYDRIAAFEENLLIKRFGREYEEYRRNVPRWRPRLRPAVFT